MLDVFDALAHPVRRKILRLLRKGPLKAGEISGRFDLAKATLSGHFAVLKAANLIGVQREGTSLIYRINMSVLEEAISALMEIAGQGHKAVRRKGTGDERTHAIDDQHRADRNHAGGERLGTDSAPERHKRAHSLGPKRQAGRVR
ncbi:MAG TPA: metalloregulator ArsR/SmtB family transcription factor [Rhizomicrobium sp.]|nr:metalloregulator ArsR/SmtB family transcription factor [Rhizomicrobium sp.]